MNCSIFTGLADSKETSATFARSGESSSISINFANPTKIDSPK